MTRKFMLMLAVAILPMALHAQTDDMYFVPSKKADKKKVETVEPVRSRTAAKVSSPASEDADIVEEEVDYHSGALRDVDEYNRRGAGRQVLARLDGDTLYVQSQDTLPERQYVLRYQEEDNYADSEFRDDYYYANRLYRYHGIYYRDPFMWDVCFGWYDPWYDPWYGWYGPYYRFGWCAWDSWGWGWGYHYPGWCHGWGHGWHHGWEPTPHRPYRPGGSALANRGARAGSGLGGSLGSRGGRATTSTVSRSSAMSGLRSSRMLSGSRVNTQGVDNLRVPSRSTSTRGSRYNGGINTRTNTSRGTTNSSSRGARISTSSSSTRSSGGSIGGGGSFGGSRGGGGIGGGGRSVGGGGSRGGGGRGGR